jgi:phage gpG-like protein
VTITYESGKSPEDLARKLEAMKARAKNLQPVMVVQAESIKKLLDDAFRQQRGPDGTPWAPNAPATIARKGSAKAGIDTGLLRASTTATASGNSISFGTNSPYAGPNQFGAVTSGALKHASYSGGVKRPVGTPWKRTQPARPFMPFQIDGTLITIGPAKVTFDRLLKAVARYVSTGEVT